MEQARKALEGKQPLDAARKQAQALNQLRQALQEIERFLAQLRQQEQELLLEGIKARLAGMLQRQQPITRETAAITENRAEGLTRSATLRLGALSKGERDLGGDARTVLHILVQDATTVAFPQLMQQIAADLDQVSGWLAEHRTDQTVQARQQAIEQTLADLLEALEDAIKKSKGKSEKKGKPKPPTEKDRKLVPEKSELRLVRKLQIRVNDQTVQADRLRAEGQPAGGLKQRLSELAERQAALTRMVEDMLAP